METVITKYKHRPAAAMVCRTPGFVSRAALAPALTLALLIYARLSLPALLSYALAHTSKEAMFLFCNGILLFLATGSKLRVRPLPLSAATADGEGGGFPAEPKKSSYVIGRQQVIPETVAIVRETVDFVATKVSAAVIKQGPEQEEQRQPVGGAALKEAEAGEIVEEDISGQVYLQLEDVVEEEDDCPLSPEELKRKADEFIENFRRQRISETMQPVAA